MCQIFAGQPTDNYRQITRSFRLHGHATSVRLEAKFWEMVDDIAAAQDMTTPQFLAQIHDEVEATHGKVRNFASLLRCACLVYLQQPEDTLSAARAELAHESNDRRPSPGGANVLAG